MSETVLYAAEVAPEGDEAVHVLGYQNKVANRAGVVQKLARWLARGLTPTGNAMILAFPAVPGTMTAANVLDTQACAEILQDMARAVTPPVPSRSRGWPVGQVLSLEEVQVFNTGIYTVALSVSAQAIPGALDRVPPDKRPALNAALFEAYAAWYPDWTIALCCFNNQKATLATPLLWWYRPMDPERLFLPALDCHTGSVPNLNARVTVDHTVAVGSAWAERGNYVSYTDDIPTAVKPYLTDRVIGSRYRQRMPNGDFVCRTQDVRAGRFSPERVGPPGAGARAPMAAAH